MSEYIFFVGDDYECSNKEYVALPTDKGQQISVALTASGVPFNGSFDKKMYSFIHRSLSGNLHQTEYGEIPHTE